MAVSLLETCEFQPRTVPGRKGLSSIRGGSWGGPAAALLVAILAGFVLPARTAFAGDAPEQDLGSSNSSKRAHAALLEENRFPAAGTCRTCHPTHYEQWSGSPHAYAQMSVVYQSMQAAVITLTNGTNGDFCIRCHTPVGMNIGEPTVLENEKRHPTSREGITCIACHRVAEDYGRISGRLPIKEGELCNPVFGPS